MTHGKSSGRSFVVRERDQLQNTPRELRSKEEKLFYKPGRGSKTQASTVKCFSTRNNSQKCRISDFALLKDKDTLLFFVCLFVFNPKILQNKNLASCLAPKERPGRATISNFPRDLGNTLWCSEVIFVAESSVRSNKNVRTSPSVLSTFPSLFAAQQV